MTLGGPRLFDDEFECAPLVRVGLLGADQVVAFLTAKMRDVDTGHWVSGRDGKLLAFG